MSTIYDKNKKETINRENSECIADIYKELRNKNLSITLREIIKWLRREKNFDFPYYHLAGFQLISSRYSNQNVKNEIKSIFMDKFKLQNLDIDKEDIKIQQRENNVIFEEESLKMIFEGKLNNSRLFKDGREPPKSFQRSLVRLGFAVLNKDI